MSAHDRLIIVSTLFLLYTAVFAGTDLPLLSATNAQLPVLSISYAAPTDPAAKALTDAKNGELFNAGMDGFFLSLGTYFVK